LNRKENLKSHWNNCRSEEIMCKINMSKIKMRW